MNDPYSSSSGAHERRVDVSDLEWVKYTRWTLWFCAASYVLLGAIFSGVFVLALSADPEMEGASLVFALPMGLFMFASCAMIGAVNVLAAHGLAMGARWGWILALVLGGIYAPSGCMPVGAVILYGLLNERVRKAFIG